MRKICAFASITNCVACPESGPTRTVSGVETRMGSLPAISNRSHGNDLPLRLSDVGSYQHMPTCENVCITV